MRPFIICGLLCFLMANYACNRKSTIESTDAEQTEQQQRQDNNSMATEFIVKLKAGITPEELVKEFQDEKLMRVKDVVPVMNIWLFAASEKALKTDELLAKLRASDLVDEAQLNHKLELRK